MLTTDDIRRGDENICQQPQPLLRTCHRSGSGLNETSVRKQARLNNEPQGSLETQHAGHRYMTASRRPTHEIASCQPARPKLHQLIYTLINLLADNLSQQRGGSDNLLNGATIQGEEKGSPKDDLHVHCAVSSVSFLWRLILFPSAAWLFCRSEGITNESRGQC